MKQFDKTVLDLQSQTEYQQYLNDLEPNDLIKLYQYTIIENTTNDKYAIYDSDIGMRLFYIELVMRLRMEGN